MKLRDLITEKTKPGYVRLANSLDPEVTPAEIKKYLHKMDSDGTMEKIIKLAEKSNNPVAYKWAAVRKILNRHFSK